MRRRAVANFSENRRGCFAIAAICATVIAGLAYIGLSTSDMAQRNEVIATDRTQ